MNPEHDILIRVSPSQGKITIEEQEGLVTTRKEVDRQTLLSCFRNSLRIDDPGYASGFLPLNCLSVWQDRREKRLVLWHPRLYADVSLYDTNYPHFPIPRMVFGFSVDLEGRVSRCRVGVAADETPSPDTVMYHYPFSNVNSDTVGLCVGANTMPAYKKLYKAMNLPGFLLSIPNNMDSYSSERNRLGLDYRELMEHLKDKAPAYYYSDVLIPNGRTLEDFIKS
ncbi:MAG: hypothetical protein HFF18_06280 [Oscillospiraceae bacterium]|nr:hypothetical protein [Oscillospiraceae bacterium]